MLNSKSEVHKNPEETPRDSQNDENLLVPCNSPNNEVPLSADNEDDITMLTNRIKELHKKYGTNSHAMLVAKLQKVNSRTQWDTFMFSGFNPTRYTAGAAIRVKPTALYRRREGVTRGSKRSSAGRPALGSSRPVKKRKRCLAHNINKNQANAKSH